MLLFFHNNSYALNSMHTSNVHINCYISTSNRSIDSIQEGIGIQLGNLLTDLSTFIVGIGLGLFVNWKLALSVVVLLPFLSLLAALNVTVRVAISIHLR